MNKILAVLFTSALILSGSNFATVAHAEDASAPNAVHAETTQTETKTETKADSKADAKADIKDGKHHGKDCDCKECAGKKGKKSCKTCKHCKMHGKGEAHEDGEHHADHAADDKASASDTSKK